MNDDAARARRRRLVFAVVILAVLAAAWALYAGLTARAGRWDAEKILAHHAIPPLPNAPTPADSGMRYTAVPLGARDGTKLAGWWIIPEDGTRRPDLAVVVMAHAEDPRGKASLLTLAPALHRAGYILLLFD